MVIVVICKERSFMAYFLKKATLKGRTYLSIVESFYSHDKKGTAHRTYKSLGSVETLKLSGIDDPISFYQVEVNRLNLERKNAMANNKINQRLISDISPERYLGYFPLANVMNTLDVQMHFDYMQSTRDFRFNVFDIFSSLVYARAVAPLSKHKTFHDVLPSLLNQVDFSYDQLLDAVEFVGSEYEKFVEIFTVATKENYGIDTKKTYFDCTNYYFEIDKESTLQKKGPSKENRKDPIVGMGLLLDSNMIPCGMKIYPGNESEKPILRSIISQLKNQNNITGRTIQIADKGLNCAQNIIEATSQCDGYIFSKSVKQLPQKEKVWVLLEDGYQDVYDEDGSLSYRYKSCVDVFDYSYFDPSKNTTIKKSLKEKRVITFNPKLQKKKLMEIDKMIEKAKKMQAAQAKRDEYGESSRYVIFTDEDGNKAEVHLNEEQIEKDKQLAGYNLLVTSEYTMDDKEIYGAYHNLWRIEESFRIMKSELDARPVYLQKENSIIGHFLICYVAILLLRIFQFKVLKNKYSSSQICEFIRDFKVLQINDNKYINMTRKTQFITELAAILNQPITNYYLTKKQINSLHTR